MRRERAARRCTARYAGVPHAALLPRAHRRARTTPLATSATAPARNAIGNAKSSRLGAFVPRAGSTTTAPPLRNRCRIRSDSAMRASSHGSVPRKRNRLRWCSDCRRNETVDTVAIATTDATHATPAAQSASFVARPASAPFGPTPRTSAKESPRPTAAPAAHGRMASSAARPPTALGLAPRANNRFDSTRRAAIAKAPAPATTTSATSMPARRSSRAGPSIATSLRWTSFTTSSIALPQTGPLRRLQKKEMKQRSSTEASSISSEMSNAIRAASSASWSVSSRRTGACQA